MTDESRRIEEDDLFGKSPQQWVREAEEKEERSYRAKHGPEDAPPKPAWPVYWCVDCENWSPLNAVHGHYHPGFG